MTGTSRRAGSSSASNAAVAKFIRLRKSETGRLKIQMEGRSRPASEDSCSFRFRTLAIVRSTAVFPDWRRPATTYFTSEQSRSLFENRDSEFQLTGINRFVPLSPAN
jgi:hypothetical protein